MAGGAKPTLPEHSDHWPAAAEEGEGVGIFNQNKVAMVLKRRGHGPERGLLVETIIGGH